MDWVVRDPKRIVWSDTLELVDLSSPDDVVPVEVPPLKKVRMDEPPITIRSASPLDDIPFAQTLLTAPIINIDDDLPAPAPIPQSSLNVEVEALEPTKPQHMKVTSRLSSPDASLVDRTKSFTQSLVAEYRQGDVKMQSPPPDKRDLSRPVPSLDDLLYDSSLDYIKR